MSKDTTPKKGSEDKAPRQVARKPVKKNAPKSAQKPATKPATKPAVETGKSSTASKVVSAKAAASTDSDMKSAANKINAVDKKLADNIIKSSSSDDLKDRASAAKKRAQEKILGESYVSDPPVDPLERLANTFDNSARRWEMVVYPSLFAFVLLAGYGFFLIYRLTHDIAVLSQSVTHMAVIVSDAMPRMTKDLNVMTGSIDNMTGNISGMSGDIGGMTTEITSMSDQMNSLTPMSRNIQSMTHNLGSMNRSVYGMQRDIGGMNRTVSSGPFGMMNDMMPFSSTSNVPRPIAPTPVWPAYNADYPQMYKGPVSPRPQSKPQATAKKQVAVKKKESPGGTQKKTTQNPQLKKSLKQEMKLPGVKPVSPY